MAEIEIEFICSSCQVDFVYKCLDPDTEKWAKIQDLLKEKEPKCEKCVGSSAYFSGHKLILREDVKPAMVYFIDPKYLTSEPCEVSPLILDSWKKLVERIKIKPFHVGRNQWERLRDNHEFVTYLRRLRLTLWFDGMIVKLLDSGEKNED